MMKDLEFTNQDLENKALILRRKCIEISSKKSIPHLGSCLSCLDILVVLYWDTLNIKPSEPEWDCRDKFVLSKGHAAPILLQVLASRGFFNDAELETFGQDGSYFHEHPPKPGIISGIEAATGSLGHGFSMALGMAYAALLKRSSQYIYTLLGDGECNEGVVWEGALLAPKLKLNNLIGFIDVNRWQATGRTEEITTLLPIAKKWESFGWNVLEINGHHFGEIREAITYCKGQDKPSMIVANTIKGKGVTFMEDNNNWHYKTPNGVELDSALSELQIK